MKDGAVRDDGVRSQRHDEAFWRDIIERQRHAGKGVRKFCLANGVAPSTFHKWRARLGERPTVAAPTPVSTPDAMFMPILTNRDDAIEPVPEAARTQAPKNTPRDMIIVTSGGMRVEMTGAYADRIVRHLLSRLNGFSC